jgi:hypothetical protein
MDGEKRRVLIDSSSALLLYRAGILEHTLAAYRVVTSRRVLDELARGGREGAEDFLKYGTLGEIEVCHDFRCCLPDLPLRGGERDVVLLYLSGSAEFIIIDDGKAAGYCRQNRIPYMNALLVPKVFIQSGRLDEPAGLKAFEDLVRLGRYAQWVLQFARGAARSDLEFFLDRPYTRA